MFAPGGKRGFERQYLRAAGSPKASTLDPWPGTTGVRLQSANSPGTEERSAGTVAILLAFVWFLTYVPL